MPSTARQNPPPELEQSLLPKLTLPPKKLRGADGPLWKLVVNYSVAQAETRFLAITTTTSLSANDPRHHAPLQKWRPCLNSRGTVPFSWVVRRFPAPTFVTKTVRLVDSSPPHPTTTANSVAYPASPRHASHCKCRQELLWPQWPRQDDGRRHWCKFSLPILPGVASLPLAVLLTAN